MLCRRIGRIGAKRPIASGAGIVVLNAGQFIAVLAPGIFFDFKNVSDEIFVYA